MVEPYSAEQVQDEISIAKTSIELATTSERKIWNECPTNDISDPSYKLWRKRWLRSQDVKKQADDYYRDLLENLGI